MQTTAPPPLEAELPPLPEQRPLLQRVLCKLRRVPGGLWRRGLRLVMWAPRLLWRGVVECVRRWRCWREVPVHLRVMRFFGKKLGILWQHAPRPLHVPAWYYQLPRSTPSLRISIVTPSFNHARFLEQTIRSVVEQNYPHLEYIIQDGGSTDGTLDLLDRYRDRLGPCHSQRDHGQADAINRGFSHATGDILAWLNSDDILLPGTLHYVADFFERNPHIDVVYGHRVLIDPDGQEIGRWVLPRHDNRVLSWVDFVPQETLFWRRHLWEQIGGALDESYQFALDWDLLLRLRAAGARFRRLPRFLGAFRVHPEQKTSSQAASIGEAEKQRIYERLGQPPFSPPIYRRHIVPYLARHTIYQRLYELGILRY